jgi:hypothetical protein
MRNVAGSNEGLEGALPSPGEHRRLQISDFQR